MFFAAKAATSGGIGKSKWRLKQDMGTEAATVEACHSAKHTMNAKMITTPMGVVLPGAVIWLGAAPMYSAHGQIIPAHKVVTRYRVTGLSHTESADEILAFCRRHGTITDQFVHRTWKETLSVLCDLSERRMVARCFGGKPFCGIL